MRFGPLGIWEIVLIVGVALLIFGPTQLPKIARGVGKAVKSARDFKDEITGAVVDDEPPRRKPRAMPAPAEAPAEPAASEPLVAAPGVAGPDVSEPVAPTDATETAPDRPPEAPPA